MKILITGGHLTPAVAFIEYAQSQSDIELVFAGRKLSQEASKLSSFEEAEMLRLGVKFIPFRSGKAIVKANLLEVFSQSYLFMSGVVQAFKILSQEAPQIVLSFGSYMAVPFALAAFLKKIPIVTHEQTSVVGVANQIISRLAKKVAISYPVSAKFFDKKKVVLTGNPLRDKITTSQLSAPTWHSPSSTLPILFLAGGSQGSHSLNQFLISVLPKLLERFQVIHQAGKGNLAQVEVQSRLILKDSQNSLYHAVDYISESDLAWIYAHASVVLSRSGANTINELLATQTPAIFIPLPHAHHNEQLENAMVIQNAGGGIVVEQKELSTSSFFEALKNFEDNYVSLKKSMASLQSQMILDGDKRLLDLVQTVFKGSIGAE